MKCKEKSLDMHVFALLLCIFGKDSGMFLKLFPVLKKAQLIIIVASSYIFEETDRQ